jgi:uncharacterized membrane protein YphA (DoxX/SURF4 family)
MQTFLSLGVLLHVRYVVEDWSSVAPAELFRAVLTDPGSVAAVAAGGVFGLVALAAVPYVNRVPDVRVARRTLASYRPYLPWMLRLSLGLPLVGAGFAGYLISPAVPAEARLLQVALGFLLLFGLAVRAVAAAGLVVYLSGLAATPNMLLAFEYVGGFLGILIMGAGQPSADGMFRRIAVTDGTVLSRLAPLHRAGEDVVRRLGGTPDRLPVVLRGALGFTFVYLGFVEKLMAPGVALAVVEKYALTNVVPVSPELWVFGAGVAEVAVGLLLLSGIATRAVAGLAFGLFTLTLLGLPDDPVLAHVSLFGLTSALLVTGGGPLTLPGAVQAARARLGRPRATGG